MQAQEATAAPSTLLTPRMAVGTVFCCFGISIGLWGGSVAEVARVGAIPPDVIGSAFVAFGIAGILGFAVAGRIGKSISLKTRLIALLLLTGVCLAALFYMRSAGGLIAGLFIFSLVSASVDLVMNSEALAVERDRGHPVLVGFHGLASFGVAGGAIAGSYVSVTIGLWATSILGLFVCAVATLAVLVGTPDRGATQPVDAGSSWFRPGLALVAVSLVVGTSIAGETAAVMFSAQTLESQAPHLAAYAGAGAMAFALFQGSVRMFGDRLRRRLDDIRLLRLSLAMALVGFVLVAVSTHFAMTAVGFAVIGVGTACIVPCGFAMAARLSPQPAAAVISMLAIISAVIRIPSPLAYGLGAEAAGFSLAFGLYVVLVAGALAIALAPSLLRRPA